MGIVFDIAASVGLTRVLGKLLYGIGRFDVMSYVGVSLALVIVAALASWLAARRATLVDPVTVLRGD